MTDYTKLVAALRHCEFGWSARTCDNCEYSKTDCQLLLRDAADAIEALQAQLPKRGEIVRCGECKYHLPETERTNPYCNRFHCMKPDDWFCADGERKVQE